MAKILITGANKGLGLALTELFLQEWAAVFAGLHHPAEKISSLEKQYPQQLTSFLLDVTVEASVAQAALKIKKVTDNLDILINNAAIYSPHALGWEEEDFTGAREMFEVNALGPLRVTRHFWEFIERGERKLIVNISSEAGSITNCWRGSEYAYSMSKAALNIQSRILQNNLKDKKIKVLALHPGWMRTKMGGAEADISAEEAARGINKLLKKKWKINDKLYFDYQGKELPW